MSVSNIWIYEKKTLNIYGSGAESFNFSSLIVGLQLKPLDHINIPLNETSCSLWYLPADNVNSTYIWWPCLKIKWSILRSSRLCKHWSCVYMSLQLQWRSASVFLRDDWTFILTIGFKTHRFCGVTLLKAQKLNVSNHH